MKKHILIVDDEASIRDLLGQFLTGKDYKVTTVASAAEALRAGQNERPDLIISDLQLEDSDGLEMIARLRPGATITEAQAQVDALNARQVPGDALAPGAGLPGLG